LGGEVAMSQKPRRLTETEIGLATLQILAAAPEGVASLDDIRRKLPRYLDLTQGDVTESQTRANEELWEQQVRNLISHRDSKTNIIGAGFALNLFGGLQITDLGRAHLKEQGF
jgi:hypothetical protein